MLKTTSNILNSTCVVCKHCGGNHLVKNGLDKYSNQRYKCKNCGKTFIAGDKRIKHSLILRKIAVIAYLSGTSLRGIQRILNISHNIKLSFCVINNWIKNAHNVLEEENQKRKEEIPKTGEKTIIPIIEMDELYTYAKKNQKIQKEKNTMINEYGLLWTGSEMKLLHLK